MSISQIRLINKYQAIQELHEEENLVILLLWEIARIETSPIFKRKIEKALEYALIMDRGRHLR